MPGIIASKHRKTAWQVESRNNTATLALSRGAARRGEARQGKFDRSARDATG